MSKRIVFVHPSGLHEIVGTTDTLPELPIVAQGFTLQGREVPFASLFRVSHRAAFYKEPMVPASYSFHKEQR